MAINQQRKSKINQSEKKEKQIIWGICKKILLKRINCYEKNTSIRNKKNSKKNQNSKRDATLEYEVLF